MEGVQTDAGLLPLRGGGCCPLVSVPTPGSFPTRGIEMVKGTILVDERLATNVADIYAAGDCAMVKNRLTGKAQWSPMGSSANLEGRTLAQDLNGQRQEVSRRGWAPAW